MMIDGEHHACRRLVDATRKPSSCPCCWPRSVVDRHATEILTNDRELVEMLARLLELMP